MTEYMVEIKNVTKEFRVYKKNVQRLLHELLGLNQGKVLAALSDINLTAAKGECILLMGSTGAGRTTLLKLIAGILAPTTGTVTVHGRTNHMVSMSAGFDNELTGLQNIKLKGALLGYTKDELKEKEQAIIELAGLKEMISKPLKSMPPGSSSRLGFAMTVMQAPDILLLDEPFLVGGRIPRSKIVEKLQELKNEGKTIILTTSSWTEGAQICDRAVLLDHGTIACEGTFKDARKKYLEIDAATHMHSTRKKEKQEEQEEIETRDDWQEPTDIDM